MTVTFDSLAEEARIGMALKAEAERQEEEDTERKYQESRERMRHSMACALADHSGMRFEDIHPALTTNERFVRGTSLDAKVTVPGVTETKIVAQFDATDVKQDGKHLAVDLIVSRYPFYLSAHGYSHKRPRYATLGQAIAAAQQYQAQADEYARVSDEEDRLATERYEAREAKQAAERNDRVAIIVSMIDEHAFVYPWLLSLKAYLDREAELQDELDEALQ